jgi:hypothetical protein
VAIPSAGPLPEGSFITCGADNTIRVWNLDLQNLASVSASVNVDASIASLQKRIHTKIQVLQKEKRYTVRIGENVAGQFYIPLTQYLVYNKDTVRTLHAVTDYSIFKAKDNVDVRTSSEMLPSVSNDTGIVSTYLIFQLITAQNRELIIARDVWQLLLTENNWLQGIDREICESTTCPVMNGNISHHRSYFSNSESLVMYTLHGRQQQKKKTTQ